MAGFRDKFKGASFSANKDIQKKAVENDKSFFNKDGRAEFFDLSKEGKYVFRILPPHPNDKFKTSYLAKRVATLKCEVERYTNGEPTGETEIKGKNIFIATQHGGLPKDPIELYIDYVRKYADDAFSDKNERAKFLYPITGWRGKDGKWNWGINPKTSYVAYAIHEGKLGRLELYESWVKEMDKLALTESAEDVITVDPFSDPDEGYPLIITKQKALDKTGKPTGKFEFIIDKETPSKVKREGWNEFFNRVKVTDEQLEELIKQKPLSELYGNDIYSTREWDLAMDGLRRFDSENKYNIFENEEFLKEILDLSKLVPESKKDDQEDKRQSKDVDRMFDKKQAPSKGLEKVEEETEEVTLPEMKIALKRFIKKQYGEPFISQLPTNMKEIKNWYNLMNEGEELPIEVEDAIEQKEESKVVDNSGSLNESEISEQIRKMRERRRSQ